MKHMFLRVGLRTKQTREKTSAGKRVRAGEHLNITIETHLRNVAIETPYFKTFGIGALYIKEKE